MGQFSEILKEISSESRFSKFELEKVFDTEEEQKALVEVQEALKKAIDDNDATAKIQELGSKGIKILVKLGKKALFG